jgi:hypothetical protein
LVSLLRTRNINTSLFKDVNNFPLVGLHFLSYLVFTFFFWRYKGSNSVLCSCTLELEPCFQLFIALVILEMGSCLLSRPAWIQSSYFMLLIIAEMKGMHHTPTFLCIKIGSWILYRDWPGTAIL